MATTTAWKTGVQYKKGDIVTYKNVTYVCRNAHKSMDSWAPDLALSLWLPQTSPAPAPVPSPSPVSPTPCTYCTCCSKSVSTACISRTAAPVPTPAPIPTPVPAPVPSPTPAPTPSPNVSFPAINEPAVGGIPSNAVWQPIKVGDVITLSGITDVFINNPYAFTVSGKTITCNKVGNTCCRIVLSNGTTRLFGLYGSGTPPSDRLLLGSVSEHDAQNGMRWWSEFDCKDLSDERKLLCNKKCDLFYIYLNGGPGDYGWRQNYTSVEWNSEPEGKRAFNFLRNSQRLGGFTCFVYYNIPAGGESYSTNKSNYESAEYLKSYFYDLNFLLNVINQESPNQTVYIILEPDMMSYILQNEPPSSDGVVHPANVKMDLSKVKELGLPELNGLTMENNVVSWVTAVNTLIHKKCPQVVFMHMVNLWGSLSGRNWEKGLDRGLIPCTSIIGQTAGLDLIARNAKIISTFYKEANVTLYTNVMSVDRYGLDGALVAAADAKNPQGSRWFWNSDNYLSYIYFIKCISDALNVDFFIWQIPAGPYNLSQEISPYTGKAFPALTNISPSGEDGAICFFFGATFTRDAATTAYFASNAWNDNIIVSGNTITYPDHTDYVYSQRIKGLLFGAGVGASTTNLRMGQSAGIATDNCYDIVKFQRYYKRKNT